MQIMNKSIDLVNTLIKEFFIEDFSLKLLILQHINKEKILIGRELWTR